MTMIRTVTLRLGHGDAGVQHHPVLALSGHPEAANLTALICPSGNLAKSLSSPIAKNNSLRGSVEAALLIPPSRARSRGAYRDRHGRWARDAVDAFGAQDE